MFGFSSSYLYHMKEQWKRVYRFYNYKISNLGRCMNVKTGLMLKPQNVSCYQFYRLSNHGQYKMSYVHRMVAQAFCRRVKSKYTDISHIDGNRKNNRWDNLAWTTTGAATFHQRALRNFSLVKL